MIRKCTECGAEFSCPPSDKKVTCSKECSKKRKSRLLKDRSISDETKSHISKTAKTQDRSDALAKGTPAAMQSPKAGRFVTNSSAKKWWLIDPSGRGYTCTNLYQFIREHSAEFGIPTDSDKNVARIHAGFRRIKQLAKQGRSYKIYGWTLVQWDDRKLCEKGKEHK